MTDRHAHKQALRETGFWGRAAAGCLIQARETGRILIPHRSEHCQQPHTWGTWGGAIDSGESPEDAVLRELAEEAGFAVPEEIIPLCVYKHRSGFRYHNFLVIVAVEFKPKINWETQAFDWFEYDNWPEPAHFGLKALLADEESAAILQKRSRP